MLSATVNGRIFRYRNGSFIAVWDVARADEHVPDDMIAVPAEIVKSRFNQSTLQRIAEEYRNA